ncbi:hypothetical protein PHYBLDRAFT_152145 [Phycomyces blakesleeanus NRRL 1555(-)]|uniref:Uncharacterized protein n=1 Tax=Phycomyces blakesleeanus (strain ATCC 8743b / DSM 1359 / FGSC 10004 / NBRC 33097 / NRRL 1555) TaxID=763407 RepID=A0A167JXL0_PHYB8|nr:hypothetical protein PHYBLDRAFT_152145 [Phycomyces blakesleeanus NRRL 1555(-)]OAD66879.1 hypothetical protein PHYBLDRAFT_152145 [Phycomyces blakesleeanus NRRL 1555(-)]|eukprot:XP_018284919.1 hypothetical protein PHYBLDRAFT_152145 [Phycomyces blakesleeanus NRRL 1555(-)]
MNTHLFIGSYLGSKSRGGGGGEDEDYTFKNQSLYAGKGPVLKATTDSADDSGMNQLL